MQERRTTPRRKHQTRQATFDPFKKLRDAQFKLSMKNKAKFVRKLFWIIDNYPENKDIKPADFQRALDIVCEINRHSVSSEQTAAKETTNLANAMRRELAGETPPKTGKNGENGPKDITEWVRSRSVPDKKPAKPEPEPEKAPEETQDDDD